MHCLHSASGGRIIPMGWKPPSLPDPTLRGIYLWGIFKNEVCSNNHCTEDDMKEKHSGCSVSVNFTSTTSTCKVQHVCYMWCKSASLRKPFPAASLNMTHENLNSVARHWTTRCMDPNPEQIGMAVIAAPSAVMQNGQGVQWRWLSGNTCPCRFT